MEKTLNQHLFAVILAGGGGTRLWPRSTTAKPKQFLRLLSDKTMLQETYDRIKPLVPPERILIITNQRYRSLVHDDLPEIPKENVFAEPMKKDTAMAMGIGAILAFKRDPQAVIINLAADAVVEDPQEFIRTMRAAATAAAMGDYLITVGIHPTFPHTGMGYIKVKDSFSKVDGLHVFKVGDFTEKPKLARAKAFLATGKYFWNANNYVWTAKAALESFAKHLPKTYSELTKIGDGVGSDECYQRVAAISIDYGISEKANNLLLVPGDFGWSDIGDWEVVYDLSNKDKDKNSIDKSRNFPPVILDSRGCFISGGKKLLAAVGVEDLVIVETKRALLITKRQKAQEVKQLVEELKKRRLEEFL